jgi:hypothetical protein
MAFPSVGCSWHDDHVARLQNDVLLRVLSPNYLVVIEPISDLLLSLLAAQNVNILPLGKIP